MKLCPQFLIHLRTVYATPQKLARPLWMVTYFGGFALQEAQRDEQLSRVEEELQTLESQVGTDRGNWALVVRE